MKPKEIAALLFSGVGVSGLVVIMIIETVQMGAPQNELVIALVAIGSAASQWLFRNGNGVKKKDGP